MVRDQTHNPLLAGSIRAGRRLSRSQGTKEIDEVSRMVLECLMASQLLQKVAEKLPDGREDLPAHRYLGTWWKALTSGFVSARLPPAVSERSCHP